MLRQLQVSQHLALQRLSAVDRPTKLGASNVCPPSLSLSTRSKTSATLQRERIGCGTHWLDETRSRLHGLHIRHHENPTLRATVAQQHEAAINHSGDWISFSFPLWSPPSSGRGCLRCLQGVPLLTRYKMSSRRHFNVKYFCNLRHMRQFV